MNKFEKMMISSDPKLSAKVTTAQHLIDSAPHSVRQIARDPKITTKTQARTALRPISLAERGSLTRAVAGVVEIWGAHLEFHGVMDAIAQKLPSEVEAVSMGPKALRQKLQRVRIDAAWEAFCRAGYRLAVHGDFYVGFGSPTVSQQEYADWDMYSKSYGHPGRIQDTHLTIPSDWRIRVERRGLSVLDGLLTLDAVLLDSRVMGKENLDVKIYAAVWLGQGRGTALHAESGFIALAGDDMVYHSLKSPDDAARGLLRKVRAAGRPQTSRQWKIDIVLGRESLSDLVEKALEIEPALAVKWADAKAVGACTPGILSWCHQVGIDPDEPEVALREVYEAYREVPATEARATILHVLRSHTAVRRALVAATVTAAVS
ncbi:MAG: hypothetical protein C7B43_20180 [Sulfobacillus benefaciens]|uniref:Uncharacterized protein n=1 Tax=Sulfobacillus benefaciens TaxID=453960 RepID=A0A2T2WM62_9FIRM|nr:MAG: hypothetical protein C7B43_20180 [Sulfobacillus benefaciens]